MHNLKLVPVQYIKLDSEEEEKNTPFIKLIIQFLEHFKSNIYNRSLDRIRKENSNDYRSKVFLDIFEAIFNEYQEFLKSNDEHVPNHLKKYFDLLIIYKQRALVTPNLELALKLILRQQKQYS